MEEVRKQLEKKLQMERSTTAGLKVWVLSNSIHNFYGMTFKIIMALPATVKCLIFVCE